MKFLLGQRLLITFFVKLELFVSKKQPRKLNKRKLYKMGENELNKIK